VGAAILIAGRPRPDFSAEELDGGSWVRAAWPDALVTAAADTYEVAQPSARAGVCLIRVETQGQTLLITVRQNPDIRSLSKETVTRYSDVALAVQAVRSFFEQFPAHTPST
jgi:hypothetical protein